MSTIEVESALHDVTVELLEAQAKLKAFEATFQVEFNSLQDNVKAAYEAKDLKLQEIVAKITYADLIDPLTNILIAEMVWNGGRGLKDADIRFSELFVGSYIYRHPDFYDVGSDYSSGVMCFTVVIPSFKDEAKLARTAELLAPLYEVASAQSDNVVIGVLDDNCASYSITKKGGVWMLEDKRSRELLFAWEDLVEVLKKTPTFA